MNKIDIYKVSRLISDVSHAAEMLEGHVYFLRNQISELQEVISDLQNSEIDKFLQPRVINQ